MPCKLIGTQPTNNPIKMSKLFSFVLLLLITSHSIGQSIGRVDKKTKEFTVAANQKADYQVFGYEYANITTKKMICFSSHMGDVKDNYSKCPLGSYFDSDKMKIGDKILYLGNAGTFGKMNYISASGKKTMFYLPKSSFVVN
jgi:hypothetical protein